MASAYQTIQNSQFLNYHNFSKFRGIKPKKGDLCYRDLLVKTHHYVLTIRLSHTLRCQGISGSLALHTAVAMGKLSRDQLLQKAYWAVKLLLSPTTFHSGFEHWRAHVQVWKDSFVIWGERVFLLWFLLWCFFQSDSQNHYANWLIKSEIPPLFNTFRLLSNRFFSEQNGPVLKFLRQIM